MPETLTGFHPPPTPEISTQEPADFFSEQDDVDTANNIDNYLRLQSRYQLSFNDRILPTTESPRLNSEAYLKDVARLQRFFNSHLGLTSEKGAILNYNPVLERAVYEHLETAAQKSQFRQQYEPKQIEKALRERYNVATSVVIYDIDENGKLRNRDLPTQPFEDVLATGIEYYQQLGSPDVSRMQQEKVGFLKIQAVFANHQTQINSEAEVVSGPGSVKGTIFTDNFLDRYELLEEPLTKRLIVQMTRFTSDTTYEQYEQKISALRPDYFAGMAGPQDEWCLGHPLFESAGELLARRKTSLKEKNFQEIVKENAAKINYLTETICEEVFVPEKIAVTLNAVLNGADYVWKRITGIKDQILGSVSKIADKIVPIFKTFIEEVNWWGHQIVRELMVGCGLSGGFSIGGGISPRGILESIKRTITGIKGLLFGDQYGSLEFECPHCGKINRRERGKFIKNCGDNDQSGGCGKNVKCC